ncbi:carbohydrate-binding protein [Streptomyces sp. NPDC088246]|uniref:carbohydrate-binding protein n=1 Tax=Streptomyces sp. NPDC088246 TaxID=3365842 RepID=UPI003818C972
MTSSTALIRPAATSSVSAAVPTSVPPGTDRLTARLAAAGDGHIGVLHVRLDSPAGPLVGVLPVRSTGGFDTWQEQSVKLLRTVTGTHDVHLVAAGTSKVAAVDWLTFRK